ncbi:hypothetical protein F750_6928 [Streptomyces sp. PAMC 26508]|nr:hypothetical protein F750_6928 [Streptomyces sp. PAMC 26508]
MAGQAPNAEAPEPEKGKQNRRADASADGGRTNHGEARADPDVMGCAVSGR